MFHWPHENQLRFCLMGYVSALFVRARHLMTMGQAEREAANSEPCLVIVLHASFGAN